MATLSPADFDTRAVDGAAPAVVELRFGAPVVDLQGRRLGQLAALGLDATGRLTAVETETEVYPGAALRGHPAGAREVVCLDPAVRVIVKVDRHLAPNAVAWTADLVEYRVVGLVVDVHTRVGRRLLLRRRRQLVVAPFELARVEREGVVLAARSRELAAT